MAMLRRLAGTAIAFSFAACQGTTVPARGPARPTVEGGAAPAAFADVEAARAAFVRSDGPLTATLEDASWIRLEADPDTASDRHPAYFRGQTAVQVVLTTKEFARPTEENYVLEDSTGVRITARPVSYRGDFLKFGSRRFQAVFALEFPHALSKDARWLRLTRDAPEGGRVQWDF